MILKSSNMILGMIRIINDLAAGSFSSCATARRRFQIRNILTPYAKTLKKHRRRVSVFSTIRAA